MNISLESSYFRNKDIVKDVVRTLGLAKIESNVTKNTTHIVTTGIRTINLLHGIIRGCWLVTFEWVLKSLENKAWLNPEKYEIVHCSKAALVNKIYNHKRTCILYSICKNYCIQYYTYLYYIIFRKIVKTGYYLEDRMFQNYLLLVDIYMFKKIQHHLVMY